MFFIALVQFGSLYKNWPFLGKESEISMKCSLEYYENIRKCVDHAPMQGKLSAFCKLVYFACKIIVYPASTFRENDEKVDQGFQL